MKGISQFTQNRIYGLWFEGVPRDTIAQRLNVSGDTISKTVNSLPESIQELRSLSKELRKEGLSPSEACEGTRLLSKLAMLGIKPGELQNYIDALTKISIRADYAPGQVVRASVTLSDLEAKAGKSYSEVLQEFEKTTKRNRSLKEKNRKLEQERKQKLVQNMVAEEEINYYKRLRSNFQLYGIDLTDVENLHVYLQSMQEMKGDPKKFTEYMRKHGALEKTSASLEKEIKSKAEVLSTQEDKIRHFSKTIENLQAEFSTLQDEIGKHTQINESLQHQDYEIQETIQQHRTSLSKLLEVELEGKTTKEALDSKREELNILEINIEEAKETLQMTNQSIQEAEIKKESLEKEILERLQIRNYTEEKHAATTRLENRVTSLEKEIEQGSERLALAETITNFLTRQSPYDFDIFYAYIQKIKHAREQGHTFWPGGLSILEEEVRKLALKAFEDCIVSTADYQILQFRQSDLETRIAEKDKELEETKRQLECVTNENKILVAIRAQFEGRTSTIGELRNWVAQIYHDLIEKAANEKFNLTAAGTAAILNYFIDRLTNIDAHQSGP